jgi:hypothetical protein
VKKERKGFTNDPAESCRERKGLVVQRSEKVQVIDIASLKT